MLLRAEDLKRFSNLAQALQNVLAFSTLCSYLREIR